jgi:hypothetical protein
MKQTISLLILLIIMLICSCHKPSTAIGSGSVIVINEGGYGHGNADLSIYNPTTKAVTNNIFSLENGGASLGDVAQSLYLINDTAYFVMNNSQKIVIADVKNNFKCIDTIYLVGSSPRYFLPVGGSKAYITELYANKIWVVDFRKRTLLKTIPVTGWTEQLVSWGGKVYVEEATTPTFGTTPVPVHAVLMIDPATDQIVNTMHLRSDPASIALTARNKLFVLCPQDTPSYGASLYRIDMASFAVEKQINFSPTRTPNYIRYSSFSNQLLYSDSGGIFVMQPTDTVIPTTPYIISQGWNVYALNANPSNGDIYISDAVDYQQASHIWRYSQSVGLLDHFSAGIISNGFVFE